VSDTIILGRSCQKKKNKKGAMLQRSNFAPIRKDSRGETICSTDACTLDYWASEKENEINKIASETIPYNGTMSLEGK
jgi:hypothetical protein